MKATWFLVVSTLICVGRDHSALAETAALKLPAPPFVVNCGPRTDETEIIIAEAHEQRALFRNRLLHLPDVRYGTSLGYGHRSVPRVTDAEARERWEIESRRGGRRDRFPGYLPDGGFIGLVRRESSQRSDDTATDDDDERDRERVLDFYFYGPQRPGKSYGRLESGFAHQTPTPNRPNHP